MKRLLLLTFFAVFLNALTVVNDANDLCYEEPIATGGLLCKITNEFSNGICTAGGGCGIEFPLRNIGDLPLENVKVDYNESDVGGSFGENCKANPSGTCNVVHNVDMGVFGILGTATEFDFNDPIKPDSKNVSAESSAFMSVKCFKADNLYATYIKNGVLHKGKIRLCGTAPLDSDENNITAKCGVFSNMFQVRNSCESSGAGHIDFDNAGQTLDGSKNIIIKNPNKYLNSCVVNTKDWIKNQYETCGLAGDCVSTGKPAASLEIIYDNPPQLANVSTVKNGSDNTVKIRTSNSVTNLSGDKYDEIKPKNGGVVNYTVNFYIQKSLSINKISTTVGNKYNFSSSYPYNLKIIDFKIKSNGSGNNVKTDDNLKNLEIGHFEQASNTDVIFKATNSIKMNEFYVGRGSTVLIKAPYVDIDHFEPTNSGSGNTIIDIYADYIDMDYIELAQNVTLRIHPFTPGKKILMRTNNITESSSSTILVSSGNYYINDDWVLPGTSDVSAIRAIDKNQKVNIFLNHGLQVGNNPGINSLGNNGKFGDNPAVNFKIFVNGSFKTGGGGTTINALLYVEGDVELGNPTYIRGAVSADNKIEIGQGQFIYDDNISLEGWGACENNTQVYAGSFNVVHYQPDIMEDPLDSNNVINQLYTQIVNKDNNFTLVHLGDDNKTLSEYTGVVRVDLINSPTDENECNNSSLKSIYIFMFNSKKYNFDFNYDKAAKNVRFRVVYPNFETDECLKGFMYRVRNKFKINLNDEYIKGNFQNAEFHYQDLLSDEDFYTKCTKCSDKCYRFRKCENQDTCKKELRECLNCIFDDNIKKVCSRDNFAVRPYKYQAVSINQLLTSGKDTNITINALDYKGNLINDFNFSNAPVEINITDAKGCNTGNYTPHKTKVNFINGKATLTLNYEDVGDLNLTVKEYKDKEFAYVDENDSIDSSGTKIKDNVLLIGEGNSTISRFYPDHFSIAGTVYKNYNNSNFTYISSDLNMSSILDLNITAKNAKGETTYNYNNQCYAKNFDVNISHSVPSTLNSDTLIFYKDENGNEHNVSLNHEINLTNLTKNYFSTDHNGSARFKVYINFEKDYKNPVNEFNFTVRDINISDGNVTSSQPLNQAADFRYGRIDVKSVSGYGDSINTVFKYEYWNNKNGWIVNKEHSSSDFGDVNKSSEYQNFVKNQFDVNMSLQNIKNGEENVTISTTHALPYSTKIHLSIPSWLWYHPLAKNYKNPSSTNLDCRTHPCLNVNFLNQSSGWGGIGINKPKYSEANRTIEINGSSQKINVNKKTLKKINW